MLALEHLLHTAERDRCVALVTALILPTYATGQMATVLKWLSDLGDAAVEGYPPLAVLAGWMFALDGQPTQALRWLAFVEDASFDHVPLDGSASFASARAMLRTIMCPAGPDQAVTDADVAVAAEPAWSSWRDIALGLAGEAYLLAGRVDEAVAWFEEAIDSQPSVTNANVYSLGHLAHLAFDRGSWDVGRRVGSTRLSTAIDDHRTHDYLTSGLSYVAAARLAMHRGDLRGAERHLTRGMRARPHSTRAVPGIAVRLRLQLAKVYWSTGEQASSRHLLHEIDDLLRYRPDLGTLVDEVEAFRAIVTANSQTGIRGATPLSPAELRLLPYLQTHLMMREIAERLYVSRNTVSSQVSSIYRKLGVASRGEAVEQAMAMGLLGD